MVLEKNGERIDSEVVEAIKKSSEKFGQLYPILVDFNNKLIDGQHRRMALKNPKTFKLENIKTKKDRLAARLVANHARRGQSKATWAPTLNELAKILASNGIENIGMKIAEDLGLPYRTIMRYLSDEYKDKVQSEKAKIPRTRKTEFSPIKTADEVYQKASREIQSGSGERVVREFESVKDKPRPKIEIKNFVNQPWIAIIVEKDFYEKLRDSAERKEINLQEAITLTLMQLLEILRKQSS